MWRGIAASRAGRVAKTLTAALFTVVAVAACNDGPDTVTVPDLNDDNPTFDDEGMWATGAGMPQPVVSPAAAVWNDQIYIVGGYANHEDSTATTQVVRFDPATLQTETLADFPRRIAEAAAVVYRDTLLVIGGNSEDVRTLGVSGTILWYDEANDTWEPWGDLPEPRFQHTAQTVGDQVIVIGGRAFTTPPGDSIAVIDGHISSYGPPPNRDITYPIVSGVVGDTIFAMPSHFTSRVLRYVASTETWGTPFGSPTSGAATGAMVGSRMHALQRGSPAEHHIWDPAAMTWLTAPPATTGVERAAVVGYDGRLFVIGGSGADGNAVSSIQVYTPQ